MRTWTWLFIPVAAALLGLSGRAAAQECESDADCVKSYTCVSFGSVDCGFACPDGEPDCAPPPDAPDCEPKEYKACQPGPCSSDDDCAEGMVCVEYESFDCPVASDIDCPPGSECPKPVEPVECTPTTSTQCAPRYTQPCVEDSDCGDGFDCVEDVSSWCSGGGSTPAGEPGDSGGGSDPSDPNDPAEPVPAPEPLPEPECGEEPLGTFHCEAREVACEADADCPTDWTCVENYNRPVCGGASIDPSEPAPMPDASCPDAIPELCRTCADGSCGKPVCVDGGWDFVCEGEEAGGEEPAPAPEEIPPPDDCGIDDTLPERVCAPPFSDLGFGFGGVAASDGVATAAMGEAGGGTSAPGASPVPRDDAAPEEAGDADAPSLGSGESAMDPEAGSDSSCAVRAPGSGRGGALGLLGVIGLSLLGLRRRRPAA